MPSSPRCAPWRQTALSGENYALGNDSYYRVLGGYLVFFDLVDADRAVNVVAIERPH